jgi:hypothetical protein
MKATGILAAMLLAAGTLFAQSSQTFTITTPTNLEVSAKAGQVVTVSTTLETTDVAGDRLGDTLVISLPGGNYTVNEHFITRSTTFVAPQDNPVVPAQIVNGNGHQRAVITFAQSESQFTQAERDDFALLARLYSRRGLAGETIGHTCSDAHCTVTGDVIATGAMSEAKRYSDLVHDSNDPTFALIAQPTVVRFPAVVREANITQAQADAFNGWALNEAGQVAFATAMRTALNRANTAAAENRPGSANRQLAAAAENAIAIGSLLNQEMALRTTLLSAFRSGGFQPMTFVADQASMTEVSIASSGLPSEVNQVLVDQGFNSADIAFIAGELLCKDPTIITPFLYPDIIASARVDAAQATVVRDLVNIGLRLGAPLNNDQTVSASGSASSAQGLTSFAVEAVAGSDGQFTGQLDLSFSPGDGSTGLTIHTTAIQNAVLLNNGFLVTGSYTASDNSTQSFFLAVNRREQSVIIGTSTRFNVMGSLSDGQSENSNDGPGE